MSAIRGTWLTQLLEGRLYDASECRVASDYVTWRWRWQWNNYSTVTVVANRHTREIRQFNGGSGSVTGRRWNDGGGYDGNRRRRRRRRTLVISEFTVTERSAVLADVDDGVARLLAARRVVGVRTETVHSLLLYPRSSWRHLARFVWACHATLYQTAAPTHGLIASNPLIGTCKPHSNGPLYCNTVIGTLGPRPVPFSLYQM